MSQSNDLPDALKSDEKRQAVDSIRGYLYQIWQSVAAWISLADDNVIFLEGAEDFDVIGKHAAKTNQVKDTAKSGNITLRSKDVLDSINHFWEHRNNNKNSTVSLRFLTTSGPGIEQGSPFGNGICGIDFWNKCQRDGDLDGIKTIVKFLTGESQLSFDVKNYLTQGTLAEIKANLIDRIDWDTGAPTIPDVERYIKDKLIVHGEKSGLSPTQCEKAIDHLLKEACDVIVNPDNRRLTRARFLSIFEEVTSISVPIPQFLALTRLAAEESALTVRQAIPFSVPTLSPQTLQRSNIVGEVEKRLNKHRVVMLSGSSGMGKSTVAKLVTTSIGGTWLWIDLRSRNTDRLEQIFQTASLTVHRAAGASSVVLDDLNMSNTNGELDNQLSTLLFTVIRRGGRTIITSQGSIPSKVALQLGLSQDVYFSVAPLTEDEIESLITMTGCQSQSSCKSWARLILIKTQGHPHLAHAYINSLATRAWPPATTDSLLAEVPVEVEQVRGEARKLLQQLPNREMRELLYRLSIVHQPFRRDLAIRLAEANPALDDFGGLFDQLLGPWIEQLERNYFRISPLLDDLAANSWSKDRILAWHGNAAKAIEENGDFSTHEISALIWHGLLGKAENILARVAMGLLLSPNFRDSHLADELWWFGNIATQPSQFLYSDKPKLSLLLRLLQFKLSLFRNAVHAARLAKAWDYEIKQKSEFPHDKAVFVISILGAPDVFFDPSRLVELLSEVAIADAQQPLLEEMIPKAPLHEWMLDTSGRHDPVQSLFRFIPGRARTPTEVLALMATLDSVPENVRARMLRLFKVISGEARLLVDRIWMYEADQPTSDWRRCLKTLDQVLAYGNEWNIVEIAASAYRGLAIVYHEYLHDPDTALVVLESARKQLGTLSDLEDKRADVYLERRQYRQAYDIWQAIIPTWKPLPHHGDTAPLYACRQAAIAAFNINNKKHSAEFMLDGYRRAQLLERRSVLAVGFFADYVFIRWTMDGIRDTFALLIQLIEYLQQLPDPFSDSTSYTAHRRIGKMLLWIKNQVVKHVEPSVPEPKIGGCSNPQKEGGFAVKDPLAPIDFHWLMLMEIEAKERLPGKVFMDHYQRLSSSKNLVVGFQLHRFGVQHALRERDLQRLVRELILLDIEQRRSKSADSRPGFSILNNHVPEQITGKPAQEHIEFVCLTLLCGLIRQLEPRSLSVHLGIIKEELTAYSDYQDVLEWASFVEDRILKNHQSKLREFNSASLDAHYRVSLALDLSIDSRLDVDAALFSQCVLISNLLDSPWIDEISDELASLLSARWEEIGREPSLLRSPRLTVPRIESACRSSSMGLRKVADILLAASEASSLSLPSPFLRRLRQLS